MVPAAVVDASIKDLLPLLEPDDILIDGGNSHYVDDIRRAKELATKKIHYVDVGTSGGVWGLERGYCMMIGGEPATVKHLDPLFVTLAPGIGGSPHPRSGKRQRWHRRAGLSPLRAEWRRALRQDGAQRHRARPHGGLCRGHGHPESRQHRQADARGRCRDDPLRDPSHYQHDFDLGEVAEVWRRGGVIASWLLDHGDFAAGGSVAVEVRRPRVRLGRGALDDHGGDRRGGAGAGAHDCAASGSARADADFQNQLLSAMRFQFGGHGEIPRSHRLEQVMEMGDTHSDALVFFGATGDLAYKKIFPALQAMTRRGTLDVPVIGVAKADWTLDQLRARARQRREARGPRPGRLRQAARAAALR